MPLFTAWKKAHRYGKGKYIYPKRQKNIAFPLPFLHFHDTILGLLPNIFAPMGIQKFNFRKANSVKLMTKFSEFGEQIQ